MEGDEIDNKEENEVVTQKQGDGKRKRKRRRAWKPYSQLNWEEKKKIEEEEEKKAVLKELKKPKVNVPKHVKKGMSLHDFRPQAPRLTTSDWMNVHEKDVDVVDPTNVPPDSGQEEVLTGLSSQFGTMSQLLEHEDLRQSVNDLTKENTYLKSKILKLEKEIAVLKGTDASVTK